jgi:hypothetical protein
MKLISYTFISLLFITIFLGCNSPNVYSSYQEEIVGAWMLENENENQIQILEFKQDGNLLQIICYLNDNLDNEEYDFTYKFIENDRIKSSSKDVEWYVNIEFLENDEIKLVSDDGKSAVYRKISYKKLIQLCY